MSSKYEGYFHRNHQMMNPTEITLRAFICFVIELFLSCAACFSVLFAKLFEGEEILSGTLSGCFVACLVDINLDSIESLIDMLMSL